MNKIKILREKNVTSFIILYLVRFLILISIKISNSVFWIYCDFMYPSVRICSLTFKFVLIDHAWIRYLNRKPTTHHTARRHITETANHPTPYHKAAYYRNHKPTRHHTTRRHITKTANQPDTTPQGGIFVKYYFYSIISYKTMMCVDCLLTITARRIFLKSFLYLQSFLTIQL